MILSLWPRDTQKKKNITADHEAAPGLNGIKLEGKNVNSVKAIAIGSLLAISQPN